MHQSEIIGMLLAAYPLGILDVVDDVEILVDVHVLGLVPIGDSAPHERHNLGIVIKASPVLPNRAEDGILVLGIQASIDKIKTVGVALPQTSDDPIGFDELLIVSVGPPQDIVLLADSIH